MIFGKIQQFFQKKNEFIDIQIQSLKSLETEWNTFLKRNTYLIHDEKLAYLNALSRMRKLAHKWYYRLSSNLYHNVKALDHGIDTLKESINGYYGQFMNRRLEEYRSFFEGKDDGLKYPLTQEQRMAIIKDDKHNLVIAGAGSGKTSVLTSRIVYLIRREDKIQKERILALAFTNAAAEEMQERLKKNYRIETNISTFHSLGWQIIQEDTKKRPKLLFDGDELKQQQLIKELFEKLLDNKEYQDLLVEYLAYHLDQEVEEESFEDKEKYYNYMKIKKYSTLNSIEVKSISERDIGNFLFVHDIKFEYEPLVEWADKSEDEKEYRPDFFLPDHDIYIEHWGLNKNMEVPPWFTKTSQEYLELRAWKLAQFEKHDKIIVETWDHERNTEQLLPNLKKSLQEKVPDIKFIPLSYQELVERTYEFKVKQDGLTRLITSFIKNAKSNYLTPDEIDEKIYSKKYSKKQKIFAKLALQVYSKYQEFLKQEDKIDFNDMINLAVEIVNKDPENYLNKYDHILVDEFQDISYQRLQLIKGFVNERSKTKLFCVGDDWQSIYQFTGSDVRFFTNFGEYFPNPEISYLKENFRSSKKIVELSNDLISYNKHQIQKKIESPNELGRLPLLFELSKRYSYSYKTQVPQVYNFIKLLLSQGIEASEIMVISRFRAILKELEIQCGADGVPTEYKTNGMRFYTAHSSKGTESKYVIIIDVTSGLYGFPCEIEDSSVLELAKRFETKKYIEEERRLFYVALTRGMKLLFLFTLEGNKSLFLDEINPYLVKVYVDAPESWNNELANVLAATLKGKDLEQPIICPKCGKLLIERTGKHGTFLGCKGYPRCTFTFDLKTQDDISCPDCGRRLVLRSGKYGTFLSCIGYPDCRFAYNLGSRSKKSIYCPKCKRRLVVKTGSFGKFLGCTGYPQCNFTFNLNFENYK